MRISTLYPILIAGLTLISAAAAGVVAYRVAERALVEVAESKLVALREARRSVLVSTLAELKRDIELLGSSELIRVALPAFQRGFRALGDDAGATLRRHYVDRNPLPVGDRDGYLDARDGSAWSVAHRRFHPWLRRFVREHGYQDLFMFAPDGTLLYSVFKESDFATGPVDGPWLGTGLAIAFENAIAQVADAPHLGERTEYAGAALALRPASDRRPAEVGFVDFAPYAPSFGAPAGFAAIPVVDAGGVVLGVLAIELPIWQIDEDMQAGEGFGDSGQTYLVGPDGLMRSQSRFSSTSTVLSTSVDTRATRAALAGQTGAGRLLDYRGELVLSAWAPVSFLGSRWAIVAEVELSEVLAPVAEMRWAMAMAVGAVMLAVLLLGVVLARRLSVPVVAITRAMDELAEGEVEVEIPYRDRRDEVGEMAAAMQVFEQRTRDLRREIKLRTEAEQTAREMQEEILPRGEHIERYEDRHRIAIVSHFEPSSTLSGDFWGMESIDEHRLGVYLVDFAGHGVNAALNTFRLHALLGHLGPISDDPREHLREINLALTRILSRGQYATMLCGIIDTRRDVFTYAAAAATHPLIVMPDTSEPILADSAGLPLGLFEDAEHELRTVSFPSGAALVLYSDALTESPDRDGVRLGEEGLVRLVAEHLQTSSPELLLDHVIERFRAGIDTAVPDDLTLISVWRRR